MALKDYQILNLYDGNPVNKTFYCNNGDKNTRGIEVHVLDNAQPKDCTGLTLELVVRVPGGEYFTASATPLTIDTGVFQVLFPNNMGKGRFIAELILSSGPTEVLVSRKFIILGDGSLTSDGSIQATPSGGMLWTALQNIDAAVAAKYASLEEEYATELNAVETSLAQITSIPANTVLLFGDSITALNGLDNLINTPTAVQQYYSDRGFFNWANVLLGHRFTILSNKGVGGNTTTQMLARFQADVMNFVPRPSYVMMLAGANDVVQAVSAETIIANLKTMYEQMISKGMTVIVSTILPTTGADTQAEKDVMHKVNRWIKGFVSQNKNMILADMHTAIVDAITGLPVAGLTADGVHPSPSGAALMGRVLANALKNVTPGIDLMLCNNTDKGNLLTNGMMTGNVAGVATGWTVNNAGVPTKVVREDGIAGEWQQINFAVASQWGNLFQQNTNLGVDWNVGDSVYAQCEFETDADVSSLTVFNLSLQFWNGIGSISDLFHSSGDGVQQNRPVKGVFRTPVCKIPLGTQRLQFFVNINAVGTFRISRCEIRKI